MVSFVGLQRTWFRSTLAFVLHWLYLGPEEHRNGVWAFSLFGAKQFAVVWTRGSCQLHCTPRDKSVNDAEDFQSEKESRQGGLYIVLGWSKSHETQAHLLYSQTRSEHTQLMMKFEIYQCDSRASSHGRCVPRFRSLVQPILILVQTRTSSILKSSLVND